MIRLLKYLWSGAIAILLSSCVVGDPDPLPPRLGDLVDEIAFEYCARAVACDLVDAADFERCVSYNVDSLCAYQPCAERTTPTIADFATQCVADMLEQACGGDFPASCQHFLIEIKQ